MSKLTYLNRLKRIDHLIRIRATGNTVAFAERLNVSRSQLCEELKTLRELGAPISYSRIQQTYFYKYPTSFCIEFFPIRKDEKEVANIFDERTPVKQKK
ncbi:MAG TPA: hypothetical protein VMW01_05745 [Williamwhitmania sp.]|nr:hypothetical protein [Williamwhitmania sp.]